jgi:hypothetical protein
MPRKDLEMRRAYNREYHKKRMKNPNIKAKILKDSEEYYRDNKEKVLARQKRRLQNPEVKKRRKSYEQKYSFLNREKLILSSVNHHLLKKYGITLSDYEEILKQQNNCCALCGNEFDKNAKRRPDVDHCHKTGKIRGLLHLHCNTLLGHSKDDISILESAIEYLKFHNPNV